MSKNKYPFVTCDKNLASALIEKGFMPKSCRYLGQGKVYFTFNGTKILFSTIELYWKDKLSLNSRTLLNKRKEIEDSSNDQRV